MVFYCLKSLVAEVMFNFAGVLDGGFFIHSEADEKFGQKP